MGASTESQDNACFVPPPQADTSVEVETKIITTTTCTARLTISGTVPTDTSNTRLAAVETKLKAAEVNLASAKQANRTLTNEVTRLLREIAEKHDEFVSLFKRYHQAEALAGKVGERFFIDFLLKTCKEEDIKQHLKKWKIPEIPDFATFQRIAK